MDNLTERLLGEKTFEKRLDFFMKVQLWDSEKREMADAIRTLHRLLATAKAEGAAEALDEASQYFYDEGLPGSLALKDRAAAIRKAAAKEGK